MYGADTTIVGLTDESMVTNRTESCSAGAFGSFQVKNVGGKKLGLRFYKSSSAKRKRTKPASGLCLEDCTDWIAPRIDCPHNSDTQTEVRVAPSMTSTMTKLLRW